MFGVGLNPVYQARLKEREDRKESSGQAAEEREAERLMRFQFPCR